MNAAHCISKSDYVKYQVIYYIYIRYSPSQSSVFRKVSIQMLYFLHDCKATSHISYDLNKKFVSCIQVNTVCTSLFIAEGGDPPSMLNILGLVRKPSTDESSLDRAPSDSEGLPDSKTEQLQPAEISEPPRQENNEVLSSGFTG